MKSLIILLFTSVSLSAIGQIGIGTQQPDSSAALEIRDTAKGFLIPRMTAVQRNAIRFPAEGLMVYQIDSIKGLWFFDGTIWKNVNALPNGGGKHTIILTDIITDEEARKKIEAEVGPNTQEVRIIGCENLKNVDLSAITSLTQLIISDNPVLTSVKLSNTSACEGEFTISNCPALSELNFNALKYISGKTTIYSNGIQSLSFPSLKRFGNDVKISENKLVTLSFQNLETATNLTIEKEPFLTSLACPSFLSAKDLFYSNLNTLPFFSLPSLTKVDNLRVWYNSSITTITCNQLKNAYVNILGNTSLLSISFDLLDSATIGISSNPTLASLTFPSLKTGGFSITNNQSLLTASFPVLENGRVSVTNNLNLTSLLCPLLIKSTSIEITGNKILPVISFLQLNNTGYCYIQNNEQLNYIDLPLLLKTASLRISKNLISSLTLPSLYSATDIQIFENAELTSVSLPGLIELTGCCWEYSFRISNCNKLNLIAIDNLSIFNNFYFNFQFNNLSSSQVNYLLSRIVTFTPTPKDKIFYLRQTPAAPPTGQGLIDKATLVSNKCYVETN